MKFNPDPTKQAQEEKEEKKLYPVVYFNNIPVNSSTIHKHLGMILDSKLN